MKRSLFDLGPEGHNFEKFVARYFEEIGYQTLDCVTLQGRYVTHEVDVIASKGKEKNYVECKFHNRMGIKNDVKVTLYVKARWDDLLQGPDGKSISNFYLASNTSFSTDALKYANGTGLKLLGVNAPEKKSFLTEINELKLYPVTSLSKINHLTKEQLLRKNIVIAKDVLDNFKFLKSLGYQDEQLVQIENEILYLTKDQK